VGNSRRISRSKGAALNAVERAWPQPGQFPAFCSSLVSGRLQWGQRFILISPEKSKRRFFEFRRQEKKQFDNTNQHERMPGNLSSALLASVGA
jgi:hypothetical protein